MTLTTFFALQNNGYEIQDLAGGHQNGGTINLPCVFAKIHNKKKV